MSQPLFPVVEVPDFISEDSQYDTQYKRSMKWDPELGDFVRDGAHRIKECDGKEAFAIWCFKIAQTERYRCLAYPDSIGTEMERAMDNDDEKNCRFYGGKNNHRCDYGKSQGRKCPGFSIYLGRRSDARNLQGKG